MVFKIMTSMKYFHQKLMNSLIPIFIMKMIKFMMRQLILSHLPLKRFLRRHLKYSITCIKSYELESIFLVLIPFFKNDLEILEAIEDYKQDRNLSIVKSRLSEQVQIKKRSCYSSINAVNNKIAKFNLFKKLLKQIEVRFSLVYYTIC